MVMFYRPDAMTWESWGEDHQFQIILNDYIVEEAMLSLRSS